MTQLTHSLLISALLLHPALCLAGGISPPASKSGAKLIRDIRIGPTRTLDIQIYDSTGLPLPNVEMHVSSGNKVIAKVKTNGKGTVQIRGVRPGIHSVNLPGSATAIRLWDVGSAPPGAVDRPVIVLRNPQVRGQMGGAMIGPAMLGAGIAATAVAVVLIGKNSSDNRSNPTPVSSTGSASGSTSSLDSSGSSPPSSP